MEKREIRREVLAKRDVLSEVERKRGSLLLTERILGHQWFYRSEIILGFVNYGSEVSTREILEEALKAGKKVYLPKVVNADLAKDVSANSISINFNRACSVEVSEMHFYRVHNLNELTDGYKGILEPVGNTEEYIYHSEEADKVLMLMPGVAFDRYRNRIGYGKGFYDRYLADKAELQFRTIGVGFKCQLVEEIPVEKNDIKPYQVICV